MLGAPPPPPPPDVPALKEPGADGAAASRCATGWSSTARIRVCASCHQRMDPLGFSLENFDALGKWRDQADGEPVDASAALPDGTEFDGHRQGCAAISPRTRKISCARSRKAAGVCDRARRRVLRPAGHPARLRATRAAGDYRWSSVISGSSRARRSGWASAAQTHGRREPASRH